MAYRRPIRRRRCTATRASPPPRPRAASRRRCRRSRPTRWRGWSATPGGLACSLGEWLSEPKPQVWFDEGQPLAAGCGVRLDARSRMLWDDWHVFINGESFRAGGRDARLMRRLADARCLAARDLARLGPQARALLEEWAAAGWLHADLDTDTME